MRLKELREEKGINQKDFAAIIGVPANTYNQWEKEKRSPDYESLLKIADYYNVSTDYILGREKEDGSSMLQERLKILRKENKITQTELSKALNVSIGAVGNWETGKREPDIETLNAIASFFNVSIDYLLGRTDESEQTKKPAIGELLELSKNKQEILSLLDQVSEDNREMVDRAVKALIQSIIDNQ